MCRKTVSLRVRDLFLKFAWLIRVAYIRVAFKRKLLKSRSKRGHRRLKAVVAKVRDALLGALSRAMVFYSPHAREWRQSFRDRRISEGFTLSKEFLR